MIDFIMNWYIYIFWQKIKFYLTVKVENSCLWTKPRNPCVSQQQWYTALHDMHKQPMSQWYVSIENTQAIGRTCGISSVKYSSHLYVWKSI